MVTQTDAPLQYALQIINQAHNRERRHVIAGVGGVYCPFDFHNQSKLQNEVNTLMERD